MPSIPIAPITLDALRHLLIHGTSSLTAMRQSLPALTAKTMNNLVQLGHAIRTDLGFEISAKGRNRLKASDNPVEAIQVKKPATEPVMLSNAQIEQKILDVLSRASKPPSLTDIGRRTRLSDNMIRPTLTTMVQQGTVIATNGKAVTYQLAGYMARKKSESRLTRAAMPHHFGGPRQQLDSSDYTCPELRRNQGMPADRFAAFDLPSRVGSRLHWPDGRITNVNDRAGQPA